MIFKFWPWWPWKQPQNPPPLNSSTALNLQFPPFDFVRTSLHYTYFRPSSLRFQGEKRRSQDNTSNLQNLQDLLNLQFPFFHFVWTSLHYMYFRPSSLWFQGEKRRCQDNTVFYAIREDFFFSSSFRSFVRLKYSQRVILYKSSVELFFMKHDLRFGPIGWITVHEFLPLKLFWV